MSAEYIGNDGFLQRDSVERKEYAEAQSAEQMEAEEQDNASDLMERILSRDNLIPSSRLHFAVQNLGIALGFVGNYAACGLSPQTGGMPAILHKKSGACPTLFISLSV